MLTELFIQFAQDFQLVRSGSYAANDTAKIVTRKIPAELTEKLHLDRGYKVYGSCGMYSWAEIPWVAILDTRVTTSTQTGFYVEYFFSSDLQRLLLCLSIGYLQYKNEFGARQGKAILAQKVEKLQTLLGNSPELTRPIPLRAQKDLGRGYELSGFVYRWYNLTALPADELLLTDAGRLVNLYTGLVDKYGSSWLEEEGGLF
jgi:5-methylcytosine-specific restriction protein B